LTDASPGLIARVVLPRAEMAAPPSANAPEIEQVETGA
jgi:hypothetical protein